MINKLSITKIPNMYHIYNRLHVTVKQQEHAHTIRPKILTTAENLNYQVYSTICETIEFGDSIPGINDFMYLPGIAKQILEFTTTIFNTFAFCNKLPPDTKSSIFMTQPISSFRTSQDRYVAQCVL